MVLDSPALGFFDILLELNVFHARIIEGEFVKKQSQSFEVTLEKETQRLPFVHKKHVLRAKIPPTRRKT